MGDSNSHFSYNIYVSNNIVIGYVLLNANTKKFKIGEINVSNYKKEIMYSDDYVDIECLLSDSEKALIDPSQVYIVSFQNKNYYHILSLDDGDFICIDLDKKVFKVLHSVPDIERLNDSIVDILSS